MKASEAATTVYVVDDHPVFRHGLKQIIEADSAFEIVGEAGDGVAALAQMKQVLPAIAVIDVGLPKMGGIALVRALHSSQPAPTCLMLTLSADEGTFNAAMDAGASGYILKEDALDLVLLGLKTVAAGTVFLSPTIAGWLMRRQQRSNALKREYTGLARLTPTERQILLLVAENRTNKDIGRELSISHRTVERHRSNICQKLELQGPHRLLQFALEHRSAL
jgi:DNA-binding NarL/FixJ family response regulator